MPKAFVIMPFNDEISNDLYEHSTKPICEEFNLNVERADDIFTTNPILDDILYAIEQASVIIADISGKNPNVFYELGMSHILKRKQTIMITHEDFTSIPFDISHFRIIRYENTISGKTKYEKQLRKTLRNILKDYKLINKNEFEMILNVLISGEQTSMLYFLMALAKSRKPLKDDDRLDYAGHYKKIEAEQVSCLIDKDNLKLFSNMDYVQFSGDFIILSEKGRVFVEFLEDKGFILDFLNGEILTSGFVPNRHLFGDKKSKKKKQK